MVGISADLTDVQGATQSGNYQSRQAHPPSSAAIFIMPRAQYNLHLCAHRFRSAPLSPQRLVGPCSPVSPDARRIVTHRCGGGDTPWTIRSRCSDPFTCRNHALSPRISGHHRLSGLPWMTPIQTGSRPAHLRVHTWRLDCLTLSGDFPTVPLSRFTASPLATGTEFLSFGPL